MQLGRKDAIGRMTRTEQGMYSATRTTERGSGAHGAIGPVRVVYHAHAGFRVGAVVVTLFCCYVGGRHYALVPWELPFLRVEPFAPSNAIGFLGALAMGIFFLARIRIRVVLDESGIRYRSIMHERLIRWGGIESITIPPTGRPVVLTADGQKIKIYPMLHTRERASIHSGLTQYVPRVAPQTTLLVGTSAYRFGAPGRPASQGPRARNPRAAPKCAETDAHAPGAHATQAKLASGESRPVESTRQAVDGKGSAPESDDFDKPGQPHPVSATEDVVHGLPTTYRMPRFIVVFAVCGIVVALYLVARCWLPTEWEPMLLRSRPPEPDGVVVGALVGCLCLFLLLLFVRFRTVLDTSGIRYRCFGRWRFIAWHEVVQLTLPLSGTSIAVATIGRRHRLYAELKAEGGSPFSDDLAALLPRLAPQAKLSYQ